ncbi:MAG: tetraacyldisaccharide 4'-kinase [Flavobacteriales bacterium]
MWQKLFLPIACLWSTILRVRNFLYDQKILHSTKFSFPVIVVGNLSLGGTGKTPFVDWLLQSLKNHTGLFVLSRGYGRRSKGFYEVLENGNAEQFGDEPLMLKVKNPQIKFYVCEDRVSALSKIAADHETPLAILDDAFQHRKLSPGLSILLFNSSEIDKLQMFPSGRLRDNLYRVKQADVIIFTKCKPESLDQLTASVHQKLRLIGHQKIFFTGIDYAPAKHLFHSEKPLTHYDQFILVTGIADANPLLQYLQADRKKILKHFKFSDHHHFTQNELHEIKDYFDNIAGENTVIFTTEKDAFRMYHHDHSAILKHLPIFVIPIKMRFFSDLDEQLLIEKILKYVKRNT